MWGIVYLHIGHSTTFSQINEQLHTFFLPITHRIRSWYGRLEIIMSRFEQVAQEVAENSYLREWYDKVMSIIGDYPPAYLTEDRIIETVANKMIVRNEGDIPNEEDRIFFTKILWVILDKR